MGVRGYHCAPAPLPIEYETVWVLSGRYGGGGFFPVWKRTVTLWFSSRQSVTNELRYLGPSRKLKT